jgi:hypothetical protein
MLREHEGSGASFVHVCLRPKNADPSEASCSDQSLIGARDPFRARD